LTQRGSFMTELSQANSHVFDLMKSVFQKFVVVNIDT
jgi:hypothetical protein